MRATLSADTRIQYSFIVSNSHSIMVEGFRARFVRISYRTNALIHSNEGFYGYIPSLGTSEAKAPAPSSLIECIAGIV